MTLPRLTVITPSLNQAAFLERTLRSVLDQGYPDLEYIVMDGASTDGSVEILKRYDDRLAYWVSEPDEGQSSAINRAIARATGEVIAYINSDDYYLLGAFTAALPLFSDPQVRWVAGACEYRHEDGTLEVLLEPSHPRGPRPGWVRNSWYVAQASSFWRRDVFEEFGLLRTDLHYVFDTEFGLRLALAGVVPRPLNRTLAVRYLHDDAKSAAPERFAAEYETVAAGFRPMFGHREVVEDLVWRFVIRAHRSFKYRSGLSKTLERT